MIPRGLLLATVFLTRCPLRLPEDIRVQDHGAAIAFYPVVGLAIGGLLALLALGFDALGMPFQVAAVILLALLTAVTGALHLDGLADTADAWLGGHGDRARMLAIMKDPACGPAGVVALVIVLLGKLAAIAVLLAAPGGWIGLLLAPMLARAACAVLFPLLPYVRPGGLGEMAAKYLPVKGLVVTLSLAVSLCIFPGGWAGVFMLVVAGVIVAVAVWLFRRQLGGFTGDTAGALLEAVEAATLLAAAIMLAA